MKNKNIQFDSHRIFQENFGNPNKEYNLSEFSPNVSRLIKILFDYKEGDHFEINENYNNLLHCIVDLLKDCKRENRLEENIDSAKELISKISHHKTIWIYPQDNFNIRNKKSEKIEVNNHPDTNRLNWLEHNFSIFILATKEDRYKSLTVREIIDKLIK